ncbi:peptidase associated/transthyretin-like domain-containing protein [Tenacibaculum maritimum]|uniref:hypothetical protein n=1 Tax=Tenacibaculum maritimum TaxID=107401 RepID=UPI003876C115
MQKGNPIYGLSCPPAFTPKQKKCGCKLKNAKRSPIDIDFGNPKEIMKYSSLIINESTGLPFETQVHVLNLDNGEATVTAPNGTFIIKALPTDRLKITHVGFGDYEVTAQDLTQKVSLNEVSENLEEVVINPKKKSKKGLLTILGLVAVCGVVYVSSDNDKKSS